MKTIVLLIAATFVLLSGKAQFTENFDNSNSIAILSGNCWQFTQLNHSSDGTVPAITGAGSLYSNPPVTASSTRDITTPYLNINSTSFTVSFNYQLSSDLNGPQTRTVEVGLQSSTGAFTSLSLITMNNSTPTTVQNFNQTFTLGSTSISRLVIKLGGTTGGGTIRLIFDDLSASANANYGNSSPCNSAPVAVNDNFSGTIGLAISGNVLPNDNEPNGETMTSSIVTNSIDGIVVLNSNGSFTFTPNVGFIGSTTTFTYHLTDAGFDPLTSNTATVTLNFSALAPLPIKLISFEAKYTKPIVTLNWSTAMEKNFSHFEIESGSDGINFNQIAVVFGSGESDSKKDYTYIDRNTTAKAGLIYYRLKSVDVDGKFTYSSIRIIRLGEEKTGITLVTYPNPATTELRVTVPNNWQGKKITYVLFNANGQVAKKSETSNGGQTEIVNLSTLAPGLYIMKATCGNETAQQKIVKQ